MYILDWVAVGAEILNKVGLFIFLIHMKIPLWYWKVTLFYDIYFLIHRLFQYLTFRALLTGIITMDPRYCGLYLPTAVLVEWKSEKLAMQCWEQIYNYLQSVLGTYIVGLAVCRPLCATLPSSGFQQCLAERFNTFATDAFARHHQAGQIRVLCAIILQSVSGLKKLLSVSLNTF